MNIGNIVKDKQPEQFKKLKKKRRRKRRRRGNREEHLSFSNIDRMMRERTDIDETKCSGR